MYHQTKPKLNKLLGFEKSTKIHSSGVFAALHSISSSVLSSSSSSSSANSDLLNDESKGISWARFNIKKSLAFSSNQIGASRSNLLSRKSVGSSKERGENKHQHRDEQEEDRERERDIIVAKIVSANAASNGILYVVDQVFSSNDDAHLIQQTSSTISTSMSSLLGAHNSAILDFIQALFSSSPSNGSILDHHQLALVCSAIALVMLLILATIIIVLRERKRTKINRHQQLESGLTSSSSANSGSTSTTKSL